MPRKKQKREEVLIYSTAFFGATLEKMQHGEKLWRGTARIITRCRNIVDVEFSSKEVWGNGAWQTSENFEEEFDLTEWEVLQGENGTAILKCERLGQQVVLTPPKLKEKS